MPWLAALSLVKETLTWFQIPTNPSLPPCVQMPCCQCWTARFSASEKKGAEKPWEKPTPFPAAGGALAMSARLLSWREADESEHDGRGEDEEDRIDRAPLWIRPLLSFLWCFKAAVHAVVDNRWIRLWTLDRCISLPSHRSS